jgi:hypothetical protein
MQQIALPPLEKRLKARYLMLVQSHLRSAPKLAAGVASLPSTATAFASTQAAWRFLNNDRVSLPALIEPLRAVGRERLAVSELPFGLLVHDWCKLKFPTGGGKRDLTEISHPKDRGYELTTALLVDADHGAPLAPMEIQLKTADGLLSTRPRATTARSHHDQVLPTMKASRKWGLARPLVHVIDRELDSVDHFRKWDAAGETFLVRCDDRLVRWEGRDCSLIAVRTELQSRKEFRLIKVVPYHEAAAELWVTETSVTLERPAYKNKKRRGKDGARERIKVSGPPLTLRFVAVQLRDSEGKILAEWMLLSNVPDAWANAEKLAFCYYWRWRIESFFKLMKGHGQQLEQWGQETGPAVARRLLVAAMACVVVWQLQADQSPEAEELKGVLVRLSGRQTKRARPHTAPALLAGLWVLLSMLALMAVIDLDRLKLIAGRVPVFNSG